MFRNTTLIPALLLACCAGFLLTPHAHAQTRWSVRGGCVATVVFGEPPLLTVDAGGVELAIRCPSGGGVGKFCALLEAGDCGDFDGSFPAVDTDVPELLLDVLRFRAEAGPGDGDTCDTDDCDTSGEDPAGPEDPPSPPPGSDGRGK